jgi:tape measure domain-containing protein
MSKDVTIRFLGDTRHLENSTIRVSKTLEGGIGKLAAVGAVVSGVMLGAGTAVGAFALKAVQSSAAMEQTRIAFGTLLGGAKQADTMIRDLQAFAAKTPFEFVGLTQSATKLLAFGFAAKSIIPTMTAVGDAVSALGGGQEMIDRVTMALGQMKAKGKVQSDEMLQLAEAGIPAWDMLAKKMGVTIPEAMKKVQAGAVDAQTGIDALTEGMESRFGGMMERQSGTLAGLWSNLQDSAGQTLTAIGDMLTKTFDLKGKLGGLQELLTAFKDLATTIQQGGDPMMAFITMLERLGVSSSTLVAIENVVLPLMDGVGVAFRAVAQGVAEAWPMVEGLAAAFWAQLQPALVVIAQHSDQLKAVLLGLVAAVGIVIVIIAAAILVTVQLIAAFFLAKDQLDRAINGMNAAVGSFASAVGSGIGAAIAWFQGLPGRVQGAVGNLGGLLYGAGQAVVQGFVNGIESMAGAVASKVQSIVTGPIDAARNALGIHSPSTVFEGIGRNVVEGFARGLDSPMPLGVGGSSSSRTVNYNMGGVSVAPFSNPADVGRMVVQAIQEYERRNGPAWRS